MLPHIPVFLCRHDDTGWAPGVPPWISLDLMARHPAVVTKAVKRVPRLFHPHLPYVSACRKEPEHKPTGSFCAPTLTPQIQEKFGLNLRSSPISGNGGTCTAGARPFIRYVEPIPKQAILTTLPHCLTPWVSPVLLTLGSVQVWPPWFPTTWQGWLASEPVHTFRLHSFSSHKQDSKSLPQSDRTKQSKLIHVLIMGLRIKCHSCQKLSRIPAGVT